MALHFSRFIKKGWAFVDSTQSEKLLPSVSAESEPLVNDAPVQSEEVTDESQAPETDH